MVTKITEQKLREFAKSVLNYPEHKQELQHVFSELNLSEEDIIQVYVNYDIDIFAYENEIYESLPMRAVLYLHYLLKGSWHQDRQNAILEMIENVKPKSIVDMGFGAPTKYIKEYGLKNKTKLVLVDMYESAFKFAQVLLDYWDSSWKDFISFKQLDMNTHEFVGAFDCYIFQDSIEHVQNSTQYLTKTVQMSPDDANFVLSLPLGPKVPVHTISWNTDKEAIEWLDKCGLKVNNSKKVYINPKVDLFAEQLDEELYNLIVECTKK